MCLKCGTRTCTKNLEMEKVTSTLGADVCKGLIAMPAFTDCDSVSAFAGKRKISSFRLLTTDRYVLQMVLELGTEWKRSEELIERLGAVTCQIHTPKTTCVHVNDMKYNIFCAKKGEIESHQLPPTTNCLQQQVQHAYYQAAI